MNLHRLLRWTIGLPVALVVIVFAVANREWVTVSLDPFSHDNPFASIVMPLWALAFLGGFIGIFAGWIACWFAQAKWRRMAKAARLDLIKAQDDLARHRRNSALTVQE
jgi:uncharacterized integral membrane protein